MLQGDTRVRSISESNRQRISALSFKRGKPKARQAQPTAERDQQRTREGGNKLLRDRRRTGREQTEIGAGREAPRAVNVSEKRVDDLSRR